MLPVRNFDNASDLLAHYASLQRKMNRPRPKPVAQVTVAPEEAANEDCPAATHKTSHRSLDVTELLGRFIEIHVPHYRAEASEGAVPMPKLATILHAVSEETGIPLMEIKSERRTQKIVQARWIYMILAREMTAHSLPSMGRAIGGKDHTTCIHGLRQGAKRIETDPDFAELVSASRARILRSAE